MTRRWIKRQMKELESWAQRKPDMTLTVGYAQVAICKLPLTNGAKVFGCISVLIFFVFNNTWWLCAYRYLQHHCRPFYRKLLSSP